MKKILGFLLLTVILASCTINEAPKASAYESYNIYTATVTGISKERSVFWICKNTLCTYLQMPVASDNNSIELQEGQTGFYIECIRECDIFSHGFKTSPAFIIDEDYTPMNATQKAFLNGWLKEQRDALPKGTGGDLEL